MDDLRQLLRYEIPGLLTILYFFMLSYPVLLGYGNQTGISLKQLIQESSNGNFLLGLSAMMIALALPIGHLVYSFYLAVEEEEFLKRRAGIEVVEQILETCHASHERDWWTAKRNAAEKNEVLDIVFYDRKEGKKSSPTDILERFIGYYHSARVIGIYVPLSALILYLLLFISYLITNSSEAYFCENTADFLVKFPVICTLSVHLFWICPLICTCECFFVFLLILIIFIISIPKTLQGGLLKTQIDELETNILLSKKQEIVDVIRNKMMLLGKIPPSKKTK